MAKPEELELWMKVSEKDNTHTQTHTHTHRKEERNKGEGDFYPKVIVSPKQGFILTVKRGRKRSRMPTLAVQSLSWASGSLQNYM